MPKRRLFSVFFPVLFAGLAIAQSGGSPSGDRRPMSPQTRILVIRSLNAEFVFARRALPMGLTGDIVVRDGQIVSPTLQELDRLATQYGAAAKPGERVQITNVVIKEDKILCDINGGPKKKSKWYQHMQVGVGGNQPRSVDDSSAQNPRGSRVALEFHKFVPEMTGDQIRQLLAPLFDFNAKSAAEAYLDSVPPKVKEAIKNHEVLVGMNREMVSFAKGRPERRIRETDDQGKPFEEWLYGEPPAEVQFVRFVGDEVVRLEIMKVDGEKVVRTEKEVDVKPTAVAKEEPQPVPRPANAPSLRRPGEAPVTGPDQTSSPDNKQATPQDWPGPDSLPPSLPSPQPGSLPPGR